MNNNDLYYKYYNKYDKNIKAIMGGGVITPSNPPNTQSTTDTITNTWKKNIIPVPPLYKTKYYSNPDLTSGYLNEHNYIDSDDYISNYYYPSQQIDSVNFINKNTNIDKKNNIDKQNPIKLPPPLITTKPVKSDKSDKSDKYVKSKKKNTKKNILVEIDKMNDNEQKITNKLTDFDHTLLNFIKNNSLYDGKYIYTIENEHDLDNNDDLVKLKNISFLPIDNKLILLNYNDNDNNNQIVPNDLEEFNCVDNKNRVQNKNSINNVILLVILFILLIIYFSKYQK